MAGAGIYSSRLQWLQASRTPDGTTGARPKTYTPNGHLWASVSQESGSEETSFGATRATTRATIRVRNYPAVSTLDKLYDAEWGETYLIDGVHRGENEIILDARKAEGV